MVLIWCRGRVFHEDSMAPKLRLLMKEGNFPQSAFKLKMLGQHKWLQKAYGAHRARLRVTVTTKFMSVSVFCLELCDLFILSTVPGTVVTHFLFYSKKIHWAFFLIYQTPNQATFCKIPPKPCPSVGIITFPWDLCEYVIVHTKLPPSPVILWIELGGKPKWLLLKT